MGKKIVSAVVLLVVLAGLALVLFFLGRDAGKGEDRAGDAGGAGTEEYIIDLGDQVRPALVRVRNEYGEFTVQGGEGGAAVIAGLEDLPLDTFQLNRILELSGRLVSRGLVASADDEAVRLAPFGLEPARAGVEIRPEEGGVLSLLVGYDAPDGDNVYVKREDAPEIYLARSWDVENFIRRDLDFIEKEITRAPPDNSAGGPDFDRLVLGGAARRDAEIVVVNTGEEGESEVAGIRRNPFRIISPVEVPFSIDKGFPIIGSIFGLSAVRVAAVVRERGALDNYGLAEPWSLVSVRGAPDEEEEFTLRISRSDGADSVYVYREGRDLIYEVSAAGLPWLETTWFDLMDKMVLLPFIDSVASVEVAEGGKNVVFSLSGEGDDLAVKAEGRDIDTKIFRSYYQTLISVSYDLYNDKPLPPGKPLLEVVYRYRNGKQPDRVSFYPGDSRPGNSRRVLVSLNGGRPFYTYSAYTDKVTADLALVLAGQKVLPYL
ncbi:MAG: DUF4340 domain-containing protein [Treponema sp.]|jgi:hypothetical protein|nr:DUF4340 domain-containing protein [Treponema sp.]